MLKQEELKEAIFFNYSHEIVPSLSDVEAISLYFEENLYHWLATKGEKELKEEKML